jgi:hypothetical protein
VPGSQPIELLEKTTGTRANNNQYAQLLRDICRQHQNTRNFYALPMA